MAKPFVVIELDKHRNLRYGYKALVQIEEILETNLSSIDMNKLTLKDTAVILFCGLNHEDNTLTVKKIIDILDEYSDVEYVAVKIAEAFEVSFGKKK